VFPLTPGRQPLILALLLRFKYAAGPGTSPILHPTLFIRTLLFACVLLLAGQAVAFAADARGAYTFRSYGPDQGLSNQAVTGLTQDRDGFIYVGTEDGLFRYDGSRFERFGTASGLLSDSIVATYREPGGRLWVLNAKGALAWAGSGPDPSVKAPILPAQRIESMAASRAGYLLVSTNEGVYEGPPERLAPV
jgi:ligand-binding sensor domain-containing protein